MTATKVVKFEYWSHRSDCDPLWLCHFSHTLFLLSPRTRALTRTGTQNTPYIPTHSLIFSYSHNSEQTQNQDCVIQTYSNRLSRTHSHTHKNACTHTHTRTRMHVRTPTRTGRNLAHKLSSMSWLVRTRRNLMKNFLKCFLPKMIAQKSQKSPKNGQKWNFFLAKEQCRKNEYVFGWSIGSA